MTRTILAALLAVGAMAAGHDLRAQAVRVRAREVGSRRPVVGALVSLRDEGSRVVRRALTDEVGRAVMPAAPGRYVIRADRIGYPGSSTDPFVVAGVDTVTVDLVMSSVPATVPELEVVSRAPVVCALDAAAAGPVAMLWAEARKALAAAELTSQQLPMLEVIRYERLLGEGSAIAGEQVERFHTDSVMPFIAADPGRLAKDGYLERRGGDALFFAPDAGVLLSDEFLADHCFFGLATADSVGLVGLGFEPVSGRSRRGADVRGTLWLDRATFELRFLDFSYTDLAKQFRSGRDGGRIEFARLPGGGWVTHRWRVRVADRERGGELSVIGGRRGIAVLAGQVVDSLAGLPLAGAVIAVGGGAYRDTTEADGRYRIEVPTSGEFTVTMQHPLASLVGAPSVGRVARLQLGSESVLDFGIPSRPTLEARMCRNRPVEPDGELILIGAVTDSSGMGQIGSVRIAWPAGTALRPGYRLEVGEGGTAVNFVTGGDGRFQVCGVPGTTDVSATATVGPRRAKAVATRIGPSVAAVRLVVP